MTIFNAILQPALIFHVESQTFSRRIASQDRHHRSRNTVDDEFDVVLKCKALEEELCSLWQQRPSLFDLTIAELCTMVHPRLAALIMEICSVYKATFWAHFLHIHRTAWWTLELSPTPNGALDELWRTLQNCVEEHPGATLSSGVSTTSPF